MEKTNILKKKSIYVSFLLNVLIILNFIHFLLSDDSSTTINTETLTSIVRYSLDDSAASYAAISTTPLGNLICSASYYDSLSIKYYYGLKPNGRPYFTKNGKETEFSNTVSDKARYEGNIYGIQLADTSNDNKEYIFAIGNNNANFEVYDFSSENPIIYYKHGKTLLGTDYNSFKYGTIFKLNKTDAGNIYLLGLILQHTDYQKYFNLLKLSFTSPNIDTNYPISQRGSFLSADEYFSSCFETDNNYIICFYTDSTKKLKLAAFDYDFTYPKSFIYIDNTKDNKELFYKCIHFTGEVGAFLFFNNDKICIQFKKYESSNFNSYFSTFSQIEISNEGYSNHVQKCDLIKIVDKKFCYLTLSSNFYELNLFIFENFVEEKFIIRHYTVKTQEKNNFVFGNELKMTLYNDYIAIAAVGCLNSVTSYSFLIIFSYPNSTDFSIDITETLNSGTNPIINFSEKCKIENNIFGYEPFGIKLIDFSNGLKLLNEDDKTTIAKDSIFNKNVELNFNEDIDLTSSLRIEYAMVVKDAPYSSFKDYSEIININLCNNAAGECEEESYYQQKEHIGRTSYCDIIIDSGQISKTCDTNCFLCKKDSQECLICEDNLLINQDDNKKCIEKIIPPSTFQSKNPSTIPEIISASTSPEKISASTEVIKNIPSTLIEIAPSTLINKIPTTIPKINIKITSSTLPLIKNTEKIIETHFIISEKTNEKNCSVSEILNNKCLNGNININQIDEIKNSLLTEDYKGENTIIETETIIIQLSKLEDQANQDNANISNIDLGECEDLLRETNNLKEDEDLIIYKIDIKTSDSSSTYVTYEVYDSQLNQLNLDVCSETQITIHVPVHLDDTLDSLAKSLSDSGYNLFNENDSFYNDICSTFTSENGTDMLLSDRKKDIYSNTQNTSICQSDCELESYNSTSKKAKCNCEVKTSSTINSLNIDNLFNKKEIAKSFYDTLANSNFLVLKCYKLVIDSSIVLKNYGEIIMTALMLVFLIMMIIYFIAGSRKIHEFLYTILKWNVENGPDKNNKFEEESVINSQEKKIVHESIKERKVKKGKRIKFKTENAPPKKRKKEHVQFGSVVNNNNIIKNNNKAGKLMSSSSDLKQIKSEGMEIKKNKNKIKDEKRRHHTNKDYNTKKNFNETEENNKKENLETGYVDYKKKDLTDTELDDLEYELAIIYDKRTFLDFYWCVLKQNQLIIFTFLPMNDYNLIYAKIALFIISFGLFITINGFFFSDDTMHKVYQDNGKFDILFQIPQILYSSIISSVANILLKNLSLSENNILELKQETYFSINKAKKKARQIERCLRIKLILFFIISLILMLFFWYFISCFCAVYRNTQIILLKDTGISFGLSLVYPFALSFLPGIFRIPALRAKNQNLKCLYKISSIMNWLI